MKTLLKTSLMISFLLICLGSIAAETAKSPGSENNSKIPSLAEEVTPLAVGSKAPNANLRTTTGEAVTINEISSNKPKILIFYRGGWCPFCNTQLGQLATVEGQLRELGYQLIAVSPDRPKKLAQSVKDRSLNYQLLSDSKMELSKAYGLAFKVDADTVALYKNNYNIDIEADSGESHHLLPVPAVVIIGSDNLMKYIYWNADYKIRLDPQALLQAAKDIKH